jgi:hypothetical protein
MPAPFSTGAVAVNGAGSNGGANGAASGTGAATNVPAVVTGTSTPAAYTGAAQAVKPAMAMLALGAAALL